MIEEILKRHGAEVLRKDDFQIIAEVPKAELRSLARELFEAGCYYATGIGADEREKTQSFAMYHVLNCEKEKKYVVLKVKGLKIPSITPEIKGANWAEREAMDMLGIEFEGHPEPRRLILPDDWPEGVYPLRKDFKYDERPPLTFKTCVPPTPRDAIRVPVGPFHPTLHEPEYFELRVKGHKIVGATYRGFHVHRGMEKLAESRMTIHQIPFLAERICGICGFTHSCAYCQAIEKAISLEIPERAEYIRTILLEIERIHSHLLWFGVAFHLLGFDTGFMHAWRIREHVMDLAELLTGNRKTYGMNLPGGVRRDINEEKKEKTLKVLDQVGGEIKELLENSAQMKEIVSRIKEVGILPREEGREIGVLGPVARASSIDTDVRRDHPYAAYPEVEFEVPVYDGCDVLSRFLVRVEETFESIKIVREALENLPPGEIILEEFEMPEFKFSVGATEAPRGEDVHFVITGEANKVYRWRPRAPTYNNLPAIPIMLDGENLADAPIIIASIDPCFSCTDHVTVVEDNSDKVLWKGSLEEFLRRGFRWGERSSFPELLR